jgi:hypothetical protein
MTDTDLETEITKATKYLENLQRQKAKLKKPPKPKSDIPRGRPRVDPMKIKLARELAKKYPLPDVALSVGIGLKTLYRYNIKRFVLDMEMADEIYRAAQKKAVTSDL